jgi:nicotinamide riboside kinase
LGGLTRIAFCASHSTGKSTLVDELKQLPEFKQYKVFDGIGRKVHKKNWSEKRKQRYINYWYVYNHYMYRNFLASRSIVDTYAYSRVLISPKYHRRLFNWAIDHIMYDYLFYIPVEFDIVDDGERYVSKGLQTIHDQEIRNILNWYHLPYYEVSGSIQERLTTVKEVLNVGGFVPLLTKSYLG